MASITLVLMPGLDGTGKLFGPLLKVIPSSYEPIILSYPDDRHLSQTELLEYVSAKLPSRPFVLLAESYSGPLAIQLASTLSSQVLALIVCATFVTNPLSPPLGWLVRTLGRFLFRLSPPAFLIRHFLLGKEAPVELISLFREALTRGKPEILFSRVHDVLKCDARDALRNCRVPILYLAAKKDKLVGPKSLKEMKAVLATIQEGYIEGPHFILQREPLKAFQRIDDFLRRLEILPGMPSKLEPDPPR